jgi:hypothetical protein
MTLFRVLMAALTAFVLCCAPASALTRTVSLDAEPGGLSQFAATEISKGSASTNPSVRVVSKQADPRHVAQGGFSLQYDMPAGGNRVENVWSYSAGDQFREGDDVWIAQQIYLDPTAWAELGWNIGHHVIMQIKTTDKSRGGPFSMDDRDNRWTWGPNGSTEVISRPVVKGAWEQWLYHFRFSSNPSQGRVTIYRNGALVYDAARATLHRGYGAYFKQGIYQNTHIRSPSRMWVDGTTISPVRAEAERGAWGSTGSGLASGQAERGAGGSTGSGLASGQAERGAGGSTGSGLASGQAERDAGGSTGSGLASGQAERDAGGSTGSGRASGPAPASSLYPKAPWDARLAR